MIKVVSRLADRALRLVAPKVVAKATPVRGYCSNYGCQGYGQYIPIRGPINGRYICC